MTDNNDWLTDEVRKNFEGYTDEEIIFINNNVAKLGAMTLKAWSDEEYRANMPTLAELMEEERRNNNPDKD